MKRWLCVILAMMMLLGAYAGLIIDVRAASMEFSDTAIELLKKIEGFWEKPEWDVSQWTVGYGTRCPDDKLEYYKANGITEEEALELLYNMLDDFENAVNSFAAQHNLSLTQNQFDALVMFSYNCGTSWTSETTGYFNNAVRNGSKGTAFIYAICLWSSSAGSFILTKRRMSEANMYLNGVYEAYNDSEDGTYPATFKYVYMDGNGGKVDYIMHGYDASDSSPILTKTTAPTGIDSNGNSFTYEFAGWYTASEGGTKIEVLDGSLADGSVLYAQWKDSAGKIVSLPKGETCSVEAKFLGDVNVRTGPGTYYPKVQEEQLKAGTPVTITQTYTYGGILWGKCQYGWITLAYTNYNDVLAGQETWPRTGTVTGDNVNIRNGAGTSNTMQYQLNTGDRVTIYEKVYAGNLYWGRLEDGNWICMTYVKLDEIKDDSSDDEAPVGLRGDIDADGTLTKDDAIYLLRHVVFPEKYPISVDGDMTRDGTVNKDDAIYLLRHVVFPEKYPLHS